MSWGHVVQHWAVRVPREGTGLREVGVGRGIGEPGEEAFWSREGGGHRQAAGVRVVERPRGR